MNDKDNIATAEMPLLYLFKWVEMVARARVERAIRDMPVSGTQLLVLVLLRERGEATSAELARMMRLTPQAMTTLLRPLRDGGLIERRQDDDHGRRLLMRLTDHGLSILKDTRRLIPEIEDDLLDGFSEEECELLRRLLSRIARRLDQADDGTTS